MFAKLRAIGEFRKRHLAFLETVADYDLILEVGRREELGQPLTLKQLHLLGMTSVPTLQRRLRRLRQLRAIAQRRCKHDGREVELKLNPRLHRLFVRYLRVMRAALR